MNSILGKFVDGGPVFTVVIFICLILVTAFFAAALMHKSNSEKYMLLIKHIGWFAVAWGFLGRTFGLINAFDAVSAHGELTPSLLADGLKMALVDPLMGIVTFAIARVFIIVLVIRKK